MTPEERAKGDPKGSSDDERGVTRRQIIGAMAAGTAGGAGLGHLGWRRFQLGSEGSGDEAPLNPLQSYP
ncbi:MAG: hypothetical protein ACOC0F_02170, partial [archaeon]